MPNRISRIARSKIHNPSDNILQFLSAAAMSILSFNYGTTIANGGNFYILPVIPIPIPDNAISAISASYLCFFLTLISYAAFSNLTLILKINSPRFRARLISCIADSCAQKHTHEDFLNITAPTTIFLDKHYEYDHNGDKRKIIFEPPHARAFFIYMKRFRIECQINNSVIDNYNAEGLSITDFKFT